MTEIRPMTEEDVEQVARIEQDCFSMPWSAQAFSEALNKKEYFYMVAVRGDAVLGYCGLYQVLDEGNITQVAVRSDERRKGIARKLLQDFMQKGKMRGIESYTLEVRVSNKQAIALYETCGFVSECVRKGFYSAPVEDACIMWKR